jgi:poly(3-hydroxybutyrate) depolymerase
MVRGLQTAVGMRIVLAVVFFAACATDDAPPGEPIDDVDAGGATDDVDAAGADDPDAATPASYPCEPTPTAGHQLVTCPGGLTVDVEASAACVGGGCGLIVDLHGLTGTAEVADAHTRLRALGPPRGYIVLQPTSPGELHEWSSGMFDDAVWSFAQAARDRFGVDRDRVHVMGFSQGGMMTLRLLCDHADEIASVAPAAGGGCFGGGAPAVPRPILYTHGTADPIVDFGFGVAVRDGAIASYGLDDAETFGQGALYTATRWRGDGGEVLLEFWQHDFTAPPLFGFYEVGGHCLPGPISEQEFRCRDEGQFDHTLEVLRFFDEHPR